MPTPQPADILASHWLPSGHNVIPVVLTKFSPAELREKWLAVPARLRALRDAGSVAKLFFNENLTLACKDQSEGTKL